MENTMDGGFGWFFNNIFIPSLVGIAANFLFSRFKARYVAPKYDDDLPLKRGEKRPISLTYEGKPPFGYYKLSKRTAKRMEPVFYKQLMDYFVQGMIALIVISIVMVNTGFALFAEGEQEYSLVFSLSLLIFLILFPWRMIFKDYD